MNTYVYEFMPMTLVYEFIWFIYSYMNLALIWVYQGSSLKCSLQERHTNNVRNVILPFRQDRLRQLFFCFLESM